MKNNMRTIDDLFELAEKALIGFTRDRLEPSFLHQSYPPCNILKVSESEYQIELSVAGFTKEDIEINYLPEKHQIEVKGNKKEVEEQKEEKNEIQYIHRGLAQRSFVQTFNVGDNVEIKEAKIENGILYVLLEKFIPEEKLPKRIEIK